MQIYQIVDLLKMAWKAKSHVSLTNGGKSLSYGTLFVTMLMLPEKKGMYTSTDSATPNRKGISHSEAGRIGKIKIRTMPLYESKDSSGRISLSDLFGKPWKKNILTGNVELEN